MKDHKALIERVFDSTVGRGFLKVEPDPDHGLRGTTTRNEFSRGFAKLVSDVALGRMMLEQDVTKAHP